MKKVLCGFESMSGKGGISRVARLISRVIGEEIVEGRLSASAVVLSDSSPPPGSPMPVTAVSGSRLPFVIRVNLAIVRYTHFIYDFLGMARAHGWLPIVHRPFMSYIHGLEVWPGPWAQADRIASACRASLLISNTAYTRDRATTLHPTFARAKVCWLATEEDTLPPECAKPLGPRRVLILGRMDSGQYKGHQELIEAWPRVLAAVPDAVLTIAGTGPALLVFQKLASECGLLPSQIEFRGLVPESKLGELWAETTLLAMPSRGEGFGIVYIEAMRHGVPVIASIHDAAPEVNLDGITGYNVSLDHADELPDRIIHLLRNPTKAAAFGSAGQARWAAHFRYSAFRERFRPLLAEFLTM